MRSNKSKSRLDKSPLSFLFVLTLTVSVALTGMFGLYPNNPITQQYRTVFAHNIAPEFLAPVNDFLGLLNLQPIPEDQYQPGDGLVLDPGGWLLEQVSVTVPPLYGPDRTVVVLDPAGALLELLGVDVAALPESTAPLDPAAWIFQQIGLTLPPESSNENPPDPAGTLLVFLFPGYDPESVSEPLLDPGGMVLAWLIPSYQPPPINDSQNPPLDPGGQLLAWLVSPQLFNTSDSTLNLGDVILSWLFLPASESQLPSEQDIVDAAMTSIAETQIVFLTSTASSPTSTVSLTQTQTQPSAPTFTLVPTATGTLTPTWTVPPVVIFPTSTKTPSPPDTPTFTSTPTPAPDTPTFTSTPTSTPDTPTFTSTPTSTPDTPTFTSTPTPTPPVVNSLNDPGNGVCDASECTLREAIVAVSPGGTITFNSSLSGQTITLTSGELAIAKNLTINGSVLASQVTISGNNASRVFNITGGANVTLNSLTIANGRSVPGDAGGILVGNSAFATVNNSTILNNNAEAGAGIFVDAGTLTVSNTTFGGNIASPFAGGGIYIGSNAVATVSNSTFSGNQGDAGGGIFGGWYSTVTVVNSTFSGNLATTYGGGGVKIDDNSTATLRNNIFANAPYSSDCYRGNSNVTFVASNNLVETDAAGANGCAPTVTGDPQLSALGNYGGPTLTFAVLAGSPAIDAGDDSYCPSTDQRGATRPQGLHCDIGAYESPFSAPPPAGHTISSFSLNGGGNAVTVPGSSSVTVDYTYQVWGDSSTCPGCNYQLVWGLENGWEYCSAWTSPSPGDYPGLTGTGSQFSVTAPVTTGTYTIYSFSGQYADCTAAAAAYTSAGGTAQGTITVP